MSEAVSDGIRAFFAVEPSHDLRAELLRRVAELRREPWAEQVRWVAGPNLHLTLRFLGDVRPTAIGALYESVRAALRPLAAFDAAIPRIELFPSRRSARIVAAAVAGGEPLEQLAEAVEKAVAAHGIAPDPRPFRGHITLGRVRGRLRPAPRKLPPALRVSLRVAQVLLQQSLLGPDGAVYAELGRIELGPADA